MEDYGAIISSSNLENQDERNANGRARFMFQLGAALRDHAVVVLHSRKNLAVLYLFIYLLSSFF